MKCQRSDYELYIINTENVKTVGGCIRLENSYFNGTNECEYADEPIKEIKRILRIGDQIKIWKQKYMNYGIY